MDTALLELLGRGREAGGEGGGLCVGRVVHVAGDGRAWVDFPGNAVGPVAARTVVAVAGAACAADGAVLLWLAPGDPAGPIILGIVGDKLVVPPESKDPAAAPAAQASPQPATARAPECLVFEANREVVLRCGPSSLTLRKDGKVLLKGAALVSHATGLNRIKGASVQIN